MRPRNAVAATLATLLVAVAAPTAFAQDEIELEPFGSSLLQFESVRPADWTEVAPGSFVREPSPTDLTTLAMQAAPLPIEQLWPALLPQLGLSEIPDPIEERTTGELEWSIYAVDIDAPPISVRLALADSDGPSYIVLLQSSPDEHDALVRTVFEPAVDAFAPFVAETTPPPDRGYVEEEVTFTASDEGIELAGTLTLPAVDGPHPVVLLMSGTGAQDRDSSFRPTTELAPFAIIADAFAQAGYGTLRYDDRGVGGSGGTFQDATVQSSTADAGAALDFLASRDDVDADAIGVLGHSEGGLYAAALAADHPSVAFVITLAGPATDGLTLLASQQVAILRSMGTDESTIEELARLNRDALTSAVEGDMASAGDALRAAYLAVWDGLPAERLELIADRDAWIERSVAAALRGLDRDYARSLIGADPAADWRRVTLPVLAVFAELDIQVIAEENVPALQAALDAAGNQDFEIVTLDGANHLFQAAETGYLDEYAELAPEFTPELLPTLLDWLAARVPVAE